MRDGLEQAWTEALARAARWGDGQDPEPVLEALGLALVVELTGDLQTRDDAERRSLRERGARAVRAASERALADPEARDDLGRAIALAEAGLGALGARPADPPPSDPLCPSPDRLVRMLDGRLDGLSAASCAAHVARCDRCKRALDVLEHAAGDASPTAPLAVAAADAAIMRPPTEGRLVAARQSPELEAVAFHDDDGVVRLAVYASRSAPLHVTAEGAVTEEMRPGYWIGRLARGSAGALDARLHLGDEEIEWRIPLSDE